jgi:hypothetical protein
MKRPDIYYAFTRDRNPTGPVYLCSDVDPLLDELKQLKNAQTPPNLTLFEFLEWNRNNNPSLYDVYDYFYNSYPALKTDTKPFPTLRDFLDWELGGKKLGQIYDYFSGFRYDIELMPEVGKEYEGTSYSGDRVVQGKLLSFRIDDCNCQSIRPIQIPTHDEVLEKAKQLGLTETEIQILRDSK